MTTVISESGFYKLVFRSNKPAARRFTNWVCEVILSAIRKKGFYVMGEEKALVGEMTEDEWVETAMRSLKRKVERLQAQR